MNKKYLSVFFCIAIDISVCINNNANNLNDSINLNEVVITATQSLSSRIEAPALVNVIKGKTFSLSQSMSLADGLPLVSGVRVEDDCESCGFKQARINGLDGHYSQILIDSHPVFSSLSSVYGIELLPSNLLERVEVMRGGGSALYGSSAIAGTINLISRTPVNNSAHVSHTIMSIGNTSALDNNTEFNASVVSPSVNSGISFFGQVRSRDGYDSNSDGITELPKLNTQSVGFKSFLNINQYNKFTLSAMHIESLHRGGSSLSLQPSLAALAEEAKHNISTATVSYNYVSPNKLHAVDIYSSVMNTQRNSYSGGTAVTDSATADLYYSLTKDLLFSSGAQYRYSFSKFIFAPSTFITKAEYSFDKLSDTFQGFSCTSSQTVRIISALAQNEWKMRKVSFLIGARIDKHNLIDYPIVSARANLRYAPVPFLIFRLGYGGGFRAPQTYDEDLHVDMAGGERFRVYNSSNLKEERSHSLTLSADCSHNFGILRTDFTTEVFYTKLLGAFAIRSIDSTDVDGCSIRERYNSSDAYVYGINVEAKAAYKYWVDVDAGFTFQHSRYCEAQQWSDDKSVSAQSKMFRTPDLYGFMSLSFHPIKRFTISSTSTYTGSMLVAHLAGSGVEKDVAVNTKSFFDANIRLAYKFPVVSQVSCEFALGMQNIFNAYQSDFDSGTNRDSDYIYGPSLPRSFFASLGFDL